MYRKSAYFYDTLYSFKDYRAASEQLHGVINRLCPTARSLLDVGCGTGKHLQHLRRWYSVSGLDVDPQMVAIARKRCPGIDIHRADMVHFDLGRRFDVVTCLFSSIGYVQTLTRMRSAIACMAGHLEAGGLLLVEPWLTPEQYRVGEVTANFADGPDLKIAWMYTSDTGNGTSVFDINYLVGSPDGIAYFTERHEMGLFTLREYALSFEAAGVKAERYADSPFGRGLYVGVAEDR